MTILMIVCGVLASALLLFVGSILGRRLSFEKEVRYQQRLAFDEHGAQAYRSLYDDYLGRWIKLRNQLQDAGFEDIDKIRKVQRKAQVLKKREKVILSIVQTNDIPSWNKLEKIEELLNG